MLSIKNKGKKMIDADSLETQWNSDKRWNGIIRPYSGKDVVRLRGSIHIDYTLARIGAEKFWKLLKTEMYVPALGALTGNQAIQMVQAGLKAIYMSGWQVAADANLAGKMYPDQSLYPANSTPQAVQRINNALQRADEIDYSQGKNNVDWFVPIIADAEAGFGGALNAHELMKAMIEAGAAGVHFEDQLASEKKCGHLGGKVLVPTSRFIKTLVAARLAADLKGTSTIIIARTDANAARLVMSDIDECDQKFFTGERSPEGYFRTEGGLKSAIARGLAYAPYADMLWCETSSPDLEEARQFADAIHKQFPEKFLMYNCSPSFNWKKKLDAETIAKFQKELAKMGYKFQIVTLAGFHALNYSMFKLAKSFVKQGMTAYSKLQEEEFDNMKHGYSAVKHQQFVGTQYFDDVVKVISSGSSSTTAMKESTEKEQF